MKFGICTSIENSPAAAAAGWDFIEENVQTLLQGEVPDADWKGVERAQKSALPILAANCLVPGSIKITGPDAIDQPRDARATQLRSYMTRVIDRAHKLGIQTLVFGSGAARQVPEGFDRDIARRQIIAFCKMSAKLAAAANVVIVVEHLCREECNIINAVSEAIDYVRAIDHPAMQCLIDSYHLWCEKEPIDDFKAAIALVGHVHLADRDGRVAPGLSGRSDYRPLFNVLKRASYDKSISVEAMNFDVAKDGARVLRFIKDQWNPC